MTLASRGKRNVHRYRYDANGNRVESHWARGTTYGQYDAQDRLIKYGRNEYQYDESGSLSKKIEHDEGCSVHSPNFEKNHQHDRVTSYEFDFFGNLRSVILPRGKIIEYLFDGQNRRVGKKVNGTLITGFAYNHEGQIIAEFDGRGELMKQFVFGTKSNIPDYMVYRGKKFRILSNQVGTPLMIIDSNFGRIAEHFDFDEFGVDLEDERESLIPFGFAGGLYDRDTKLTHFGARDYDATTGRFITKDPIGFAGGDTNLYGYVANDPINFIDPRGTDAYLYTQFGHAVVGVDDPNGGIRTFEFHPTGGFLEGLSNLFSAAHAEVLQGHLNSGETPFLALTLARRPQTQAQDIQQILNLEQAGRAADAGDLTYNVFRLQKNSFNCLDLGGVGSK